MKWWIKKWFKKSDEPAHLKSGKWGEREAVRLLKSKGWKIIGERVRVGKRDELDIIADHAGVLVFIEVKTRKNEDFGRPISAVNQSKRKHLSRAAITYLKRQNPPPDYFRFDVVEVIGEPDMGPPKIRHIENAFQLGAAYRLWW
jgi:putative endonuclease